MDIAFQTRVPLTLVSSPNARPPSQQASGRRLLMSNRPHYPSATPNVNRFRQRISHFRPDMRYLRRCGMPIVMGWFRSRFCLPWMAAPRSARERRLLDVVAKSVLIGRLGTSGKWCALPEDALRGPPSTRQARGRNSVSRGG